MRHSLYQLLGVMLPSLLFASPERTLASTHRPAITSPAASGTLHSAVQRKLDAASSIARDWIRERRECQELFDRYGTDGASVLSSTRYTKAAIHRERGLCRSASAFTRVGSATTRLCRSW